MNILSILKRLTRVQFSPVVIVPILIGAAGAWYQNEIFNPLYLILALIGAVLLHLASNTIDDVFDYSAGVDKVSDELFPPDFPGWKVIPRGVITSKLARNYSYIMFGIAILIGIYFTLVVGYWALVLAGLGIFFGYFYTGPPLMLDFRGKALGELSIFMSFGIIPTLGSFYVQTGQLSIFAIFVSIPAGILTTTVLMNHNQIFFEPYTKTGKRTLTIVLGRERALYTTIFLTALAYAVVISLSLLQITPITSLLVLFAVPLTLRQVKLSLKKDKILPEYANLTQITFLGDIAFGLLLALGLVL
jgi:1,4-dihydroxy-2-naphthoate octaprenyltransferase